MQEDVLEDKTVRLYFLATDARRHVRFGRQWCGCGLGLIGVVYPNLCRDLVLGVVHTLWKTHDHQALPGDVLRAVPAGLRPRD